MFLERYYPNFFESVRQRVFIFSIFLLLCFFLLAFRIWYLQVMKVEYFKSLSNRNRVKEISLPGYRGNILDRNNKVLVSIRPSFNLYLVPESIKNLDKIFSTLKTKLDFNTEKIKESIKLNLPFKNIMIKRDISRDIVAFVEENNQDLVGVDVHVEPLRSYQNKNLAAHWLGYIGEINNNELKKLTKNNNKKYKIGDFIGKYGIEKEYEVWLKGEKGHKTVEVDSAGRELNRLNIVNPKPGNTLVLTLDLSLQKVAEKLLNETKMSGSIVVMDTTSGEILVLVSSPSFDPNLFAKGISMQNWTKLINSEQHPLQNRAIQGQYPPGSTYKIATAVAGLEEGVITKETTFFCPGYYKHGRRIYRCWKKSGHGKVAIKKAIVESCDTFFYQLGVKLGIDTLAKYANKFGLGNLVGLENYSEKKGLIPTIKWKKKEKGEAWFSGETVSASIGQGYNLVTPLQLANLISIVANKGKVWKPLLVKRIEDIDGNIKKEFTRKMVREVKFKEETFDILQSALLGVVNDKGGTAGRIKMKNIKIAGKTGTAQVVGLKKEEGAEDDKIPIKFRDHAWFVSYAPYDDPKIAIAVIVEHGGHGSSTAAPIAGELIKAYASLYLNKI